MSPGNTCETFILSRARTILEPLMVIVSFATFYPQYIAFKRFGTLGTSPGWMLNFVLFSTTQLAGQLLNPAMDETVLCIAQGKLRGIQAFSGLLGHLQVFAQWIFSLILISMYLSFRTETSNTEIQPILSSTVLTSPGSDLQQPVSTLFSHQYLGPSKISSFRLIQISSTYVVLILTPALLLHLIQLDDPNAPKGNLGPKIVRIFIYLGVLWLTIALRIMFFVILSFQQTRDVIIARGSQGLSTWFLALQCLNLVAVGLLQFFRPGNPVSDQYRQRKLGWFTERGSVPILYFALAMTFAVTLGIRANRLL